MGTDVKCVPAASLMYPYQWPSNRRHGAADLLLGRLPAQCASGMVHPVFCELVPTSARKPSGNVSYAARQSANSVSPPHCGTATARSMEYFAAGR